MGVVNKGYIRMCTKLKAGPVGVANNVVGAVINVFVGVSSGCGQSVFMGRREGRCSVPVTGFQ